MRTIAVLGLMGCVAQPLPDAGYEVHKAFPYDAVVGSWTYAPDGGAPAELVVAQEPSVTAGIVPLVGAWSCLQSEDPCPGVDGAEAVRWAVEVDSLRGVAFHEDGEGPIDPPIALVEGGFVEAGSVVETGEVQSTFVGQAACPADRLWPSDAPSCFHFTIDGPTPLAGDWWVAPSLGFAVVPFDGDTWRVVDWSSE